MYKRQYKTDAIVLRQRKLGEADKIVTLYTSHYGKVDAEAKGVRRTKSRLAGHLEPLTVGSYMLAEGRELDIVTQAETVEAFPQLRTDLERLSRGLYCAELVDRLTPERSEGGPIYRNLEGALRLLDREESLDIVVRYFELRLLDELGYRPLLERCAVCGKALEAVPNYWSPASGGVICPSCSDEDVALAPLSVNGLKMLRLLQRGSFAEVSRVRLSGALSAELEACLEQQVHFVLDRDVRSARFVETLRRDALMQAPQP